MSKNPIKSLIKSIVRVFWKYFIDPIFISPLPESKARLKLKNISHRIDRRLWWPKPPKNTIHIEYNPTIDDPYLLHELNELGKIEFELQPTPYFISQMQSNQYQPPKQLDQHSIGSQYPLIARYLANSSFDVIFLAPWLKRGGADLGTLHHIHAMHEKGYNILLITTENSESTWINKLPKAVKHLDFPKFSHTLPINKQIELLARVILQSKAQTIHNINSDLGWKLYQNYGQQLNYMGKKLFGSAFCDDIITEHTYFGYASKYVGETHAFLSKVFCDTNWYVNSQIEITGLTNIFKTLYFPFTQTINPYRLPHENSPILWASRITKQKRPDLLYDIAKQLPNELFHVYGYSESKNDPMLTLLTELGNVKFFGAFDSFEQITQNQNYKAFLYTSEYDGLPLVLVDAISNGLPVIAYRAGGIGELIHSDCLLNHDDPIEDNLQKILSLLNNEKLLQQSWQYSQKMIQSRHSWDSFINALQDINGYFPILTQDDYYQIYYGNIRALSKPNHSNTNNLVLPLKNKELL